MSDQAIIALSKEYDAVSSRLDKALPPLPDIAAKKPLFKIALKKQPKPVLLLKTIDATSTMNSIA